MRLLYGLVSINAIYCVIALPENEDVEIERYSDRFKQRTFAKREALESYLKQIPSNFPPELIQGVFSLYKICTINFKDFFNHMLLVYYDS